MVNVCRNCGAKDPAEGHSPLKCGANSVARATLPGTRHAGRDTRLPFVVRELRKEREIERSFKVDLRDFPALEARQPSPPAGGWLQPFSVSGGPALPTTAKWASQEKHPKVTNKVSEGTATKESEGLKKAKAENAKLGSELAEMKKGQWRHSKPPFDSLSRMATKMAPVVVNAGLLGNPPTLMT
ncbi:hypothetical protein MTO96_049994 [Rhipicephalus appendiculatus]